VTALVAAAGLGGLAVVDRPTPSASHAAASSPAALPGGLALMNTEAGSATRGGAPPADLPAGKVRQRLRSWRSQVRDGGRVPRAEQERLRRGITRYMPAGVALDLLQFIGGPKDGVLVRMTTATPASSLQALEAVVSYVGRAGALGAFQLKDASGGTVWVAGFVRNGGFVWTRPDLDACSPIAHGGGGPSECPADG